MKLRVGLIFGGRSSEHEVSVTSARSVMQHIDTDRYDVEPVCISPEGKWMAGRPAQNVLDGTKPGEADDLIIPQNPTENRPVSFGLGGGQAKRLQKFDVVFPLLHGWYGEDGTVQGLFELAGIPYVGSGVLASALAMDKIAAKDVLKARGLPVVPSVSFLRKEWAENRDNCIAEIKKLAPCPLFVKPANTGSSVGVRKVKNFVELPDAIDFACRFDRKFLVEPGLNAREIECSVLGNDHPEASLPGEIVPSREFYDYDAKYKDDKSKLIIPADIPEETTKKVRELAVAAFRALDCAGMARVDLFLEKETGALYINELNSIPGFTPISMYPKLWETSGIPYLELINQLIFLALERHADRAACQTRYEK